MKVPARSALVGAAAALLPTIAPNALAEACTAADYQLPAGLLDAYGASGFPGPIHIWATVAGLQGGWTPGLKLYETPIALRYTHLIDMLNWNCAAVYSPTWKDAVTWTDPLLRAPTSIPMVTTDIFNSAPVNLHQSDTRLLCMVHAWATVVQDWVPESVSDLMGLDNDFGYDAVYGYNNTVDQCFDIAGPIGEANVTCLTSLAADNCYKPSIMGAILGRQMTEYARRDGWNMYGDLNKDGTPCTTNCRRYTDSTDYAPVHGPHETNHARKMRWKPLLEDNGRGYETRQEHVTPHIGTLGKTALLSAAQFTSLTATNPSYSYDDEAHEVAARLALLTDEKKMKIEFFDDKIDVAFAVIGAVAARPEGVSFEEILNYVVGLTASEYDATLVAWKEKVSNDLVRPTTWIQDEMSEEVFNTYGGPYKGTIDIKGKNFESWVRVMPHSEYVSGSGCICQSMYEFTDEWLLLKKGITNSTAVPLPTFTAGSSKTEPGQTPAQNISLTMPNMLALRNACGQSRLDGGMHFTQSVDSSYVLCQGIGVIGANYAMTLMP